MKEEDTMEDNNNHYSGLRGGRPFATPTSSLASATKIINHHLFGSVSGPRHYTGHRGQISGTTAESKLSLSADSIDSEGVPFLDRHARISKSILKKSESSSNYYSNAGDSDTEKLITDNASATSMCDNETSTCDASASVNGSRMKQPVSPLLSRQVLESIFRTNNNAERDEEKGFAAKMTRSIFDDVLEEEKHARDENATEHKNKEERQRMKVRVDESSRDSQTMLICALRPYKVRKSGGEDKRKATASKPGSHSYKSADTNCLPPEYRFSS